MILVHRRRAQGSQADLQQQTETQQGQVLPVVSSSATFSNLPLAPEEYAGSSIGQARTYTIAVKTFSGGSPTDTSFDVSDSDSGSLTTSFGIAASSLGAGWYNLGTVTIAATDASASLTFSASGSAGLRSTDVEICLLQTDASETYTDTGLAASETDADKQTTNLGYDVIGEETSVSAPPPDADYSSVRPVTSDVYNADDETTAETDPAGRTTAFVYSLNTTEHTDTTTTYTGQTLPVVSEAATFANLPEAAGTSDTETYTILVYSTTAVTSASGYSVTDEDSTSLTISSDVGGDTPLGANWYELGTVALPAGKSTIHIGTPSGSGVTKAAVLFKSSVDTDDADGNLLTELDAAGDTSTYQYTPLNEPHQQEATDGTPPELGPVFDKAGLTASDTDLQNGAVTTYEHDFLGDVTETDQPNPTTGDTGDGPVTLDVYDIDGELVNESDPQTSTVSDVSSQATDAFGNTVSTSLPDPSTGAAGGPTTTDIYDLDHEMVQEVDPMDNVTAWGFSYFGDEIGQSLPDPTTAGVADVTTAYTVDADHDTLSETDPDSNVTSWAYNNDGEEAAETTTVPAGTPDSTTISGDIAKATETFARDLDGNLTTLVDFDDRTTDYSYNLFNQEAEEQWVSGGGVTNTIAYAYNVLDQNTAGDDTYASGSPYVNTSVAIAYDLAGSVSGESQGMAGLSTVVLSSAYDYNGDRTGLSADIGGTMNADGTASGGTTVVQNTYGYDFLQEMTGIAQVSGNGDTDDSDAYSGGAAPKYVAIGYDFGGEMTSVDTYMAASADDADSGNQVMSEALSYNGDSQATDIGFTSATTGDMLAGYHYAYNNDQAVTDLYSYSDTNTSVSTPNPSEPTTTWAHAGYSYDHQQQLTATSYTYWANPPTTDGSLAYDANGNRDNTGETVSPGNQVTYDGTYYYLYDAEGNRTFKFKSTSGALDDTATDITKYTWDYRNRMTSISYYATWSHYTSNTPDTKAVYEYDAYDRQVDEDQTAGGSLDERFIWDGSSLLMTLDGSNHVSQRYLNGPAVDQVFAEEYEGGSNPGVNWLLADGQGSVRDVVRATVSDGSVVSVEAVDHVFLDAYGDQYSPQSNSVAQEQTSVGFTGLRYDTLSGFYMSETREYDPATGTWIQPDPSGLRPDSNPYRYVGNSPMNGTDPNGMDWLFGDDPNTAAWQNAHPNYMYARGGPPPSPTECAKLDTIEKGTFKGPLTPAAAGSVRAQRFVYMLSGASGGRTPDAIDSLSNAAAGFGDALSFGLDRWLRKWLLGQDEMTNYNSLEYAEAQVPAAVVLSGLGGELSGPAALAKLGLNGAQAAGSGLNLANAIANGDGRGAAAAALGLGFSLGGMSEALPDGGGSGMPDEGGMPDGGGSYNSSDGEGAPEFGAEDGNSGAAGGDANPDGAVPNVNPSGSTTNCWQCANALDETWGGNPTSAGDGPTVTLAEAEDESGLTFDDMPGGKQQVIEQLLEAGDGARGIVATINEYGEMGHMFNGRNVGGTIQFGCGQAGVDAAGFFRDLVWFMQTNPL